MGIIDVGRLGRSWVGAEDRMRLDGVKNTTR